MAFNYHHLENIQRIDNSRNINIIKKFNDIIEKNNLNNNFKYNIDLINKKFKDEETPYDKVVNKIRWNTYYYKKYRQQSKILVFIIFICILMITLTKLKSSYFDEKAYGLVMGILLAVAFIYIFYGLWDLSIKDDKNFDEYDYSIYGKGQNNITELNPKPEILDISNCVQDYLTPESINSNFLNKYF